MLNILIDLLSSELNNAILLFYFPPLNIKTQKSVGIHNTIWSGMFKLTLQITGCVFLSHLPEVFCVSVS